MKLSSSSTVRTFFRSFSYTGFTVPFKTSVSFDSSTKMGDLTSALLVSLLGQQNQGAAAPAAGKGTGSWNNGQKGEWKGPTEKTQDGRQLCRTYRATQTCSWGESCKFAHVGPDNRITNGVTAGQLYVPHSPAPPFSGGGQPTSPVGGSQLRTIGGTSAAVASDKSQTLVHRVRTEVAGARLDCKGLHGTTKGIDIIACEHVEMVAKLIEIDEATKQCTWRLGALPTENYSEASTLLEYLHPAAKANGVPLGNAKSQEIMAEIIAKLKAMGIVKIATPVDDEPETPAHDGLQGDKMDKFLVGLEAVMVKQCTALATTMDAKIGKLEGAISPGMPQPDQKLRRVAGVRSAPHGGQATSGVSIFGNLGSGAVATAPTPMSAGGRLNFNTMTTGRPLAAKAGATAGLTPPQGTSSLFGLSGSPSAAGSAPATPLPSAFGQLPFGTNPTHLLVDGSRVRIEDSDDDLMGEPPGSIFEESFDDDTTAAWAAQQVELEEAQRQAHQRAAQAAAQAQLEAQQQQQHQAAAQAAAQAQAQAQAEAKAQADERAAIANAQAAQAAARAQQQQQQVQVSAAEEARWQKKQLLKQVMQVGETTYTQTPQKGPSTLSKLVLTDEESLFLGMPLFTKGPIALEGATYVQLSKENVEAWVMEHDNSVIEGAAEVLPAIYQAWKGVERPCEKVGMMIRSWGLQWQGAYRRQQLGLILAISVSYKAKADQAAAQANGGHPPPGGGGGGSASSSSSASGFGGAAVPPKQESHA